MTDTDILDRIQSSNWSGSIPIVLTLASTSLSSPTLPPPLHVLVSRHSYLHTALHFSVLRLHQFAPMALSFQSSGVLRRSEPNPGDYYADEKDENETNNQDMKEEKPPTTTSYPVCWFEDEDTQMPLRWHLFVGVLYDMKKDRSSDLPWKIRLHFTSYPSNILPLESNDVLYQVQHYYKNSLKQALCLQHGNKVALNLSKNAHERLWDAVTTGRYSLYQHVVQDDLPDNKSMTLVPIRLFVNARPPIQRACPADEQLSLGQLLSLWLPNHFLTDEKTTDSVWKWSVSGIQPALTTRITDVWKYLCHPDHFLYIVVITR